MLIVSPFLFFSLKIVPIAQKEAKFYCGRYPYLPHSLYYLLIFKSKL